MVLLEFIGKKYFIVITNECESILKYLKHLRSEEREKALHLCGWRFDKDVNLLSMYIEQLEKDHAFSRAAAIAVFNLKIRLAIDILNRGAEKVDSNNLNVVAMALAGFTDDKNSMWRQLCYNTKAQLTDPYLRAMFSFLTADNYNYDHVLVSIHLNHI